MQVAVCAKQIPGPDARQGIDPGTGRLVREGPPVLDDSDTYGVEIALRLVEAVGDGSVTLVSMAADNETSGLRSALAMGAERAVVVSDDRLAGSDALGTARVLAAACTHAGADLIIAATESSDGYTGVVPVQIAELLGWPAVTFVRHLELADGGLRAERQVEDGTETVTCPLPAVVTVTAGVVEPRYPTLKGVMAARSKPVETLNLEALAVDPATVGAAGARQEVLEVSALPPREAGNVVTDEGAADRQILEALREWKVI